MDIKEDISKTINKAQHIKNFIECYNDCTLYGSAPDGDVKPEGMLAWLIDNRYIVDIVDEYIKHR